MAEPEPRPHAVARTTPSASIICWLLFVVHCLLVLRHLPVRLLREGVSLASNDFHYLSSTAYEASRLLAWHTTWGYSPHFMAGYPFGLWNSFGRRVYELAAAFLPGIDSGTVTHATLLVMALTPPLLIAAAAWLLGASRGLATVCLGLAAVVWQLDSMLAYFWTFGVTAFAFTSALAVTFAGLLFRALATGRWVWTIAAGSCLGAIGWLHPLLLFPVLAVASAMSFATAGSGRRLGARLVSLGCTAGIATALLLPWLLSLAWLAELRASTPTPFLRADWRHLLMDLFSDRGYERPHDRRVMLHVVLILAAWGTILAWRARERATLACAGTAGACLLFAYGFSSIPHLDHTEPYRYQVTASMFALLPAAAGLRRLAAAIRDAGREARTALLAAGLLLLPNLVAQVVGIAYRTPASGLDAEQMAVVRWLREHPGRGGRVLCQDEVLGDMLPELTGRAVIGGAVAAQGCLPHRFASIDHHSAFGRPLHELEPGQLDAYLDLYNIEVAITSAAVLERHLATHGGWQRGHDGQLQAFVRTTPPPGYVIGEHAEATGVIPTRDGLRIERAPGGRFVLRYHHLATMQIDAGASLQAVTVLEDPVPFVAIDNTTSATTLHITVH
jgi:hypothetical protein